ncbi:MAG: hypothetical protein A2X86_13065 [Bdellovibrionales bacterium GWA2_49_15]|nr:MAG: hypothetical protein A2X86_13065 [Bdellovibrionales bacterium GWA2_49_15]HAZ13453.1 MBOAT family protein [Bdellovibrionales bacterium]
MLFNSVLFLYAFLPVTYLVYRLLKNKTHRFVWLTITGYIFYGAWDWRFCFLMAFSTLVSYSAGLGFLKWDKNPKYRRLCLVVPVVIDLLLLGFFKYFNFILESAAKILGLFEAPVSFPHLEIILPIGISFYTFHTISYIVDSYRRVIKPTRNIFEFSCYVCLFSQLVAGPIVRFGQIQRDLDNIDQFQGTKDPNRAWSFFVIGIIKKVLIADTIAMIINPALKNYITLSSLETWLCMLGYTYQLYFDFSGYSDMAVGLGLLFNIQIPQNFNSPYKSIDLSDFWRRWHISLSTCLRDYLYIPLGGNRFGVGKTYRNMLLTMGFGGLWHGANWTFVIWGLYHGMFLSLNRVYSNRLERIPTIIRQLLTFFVAIIGWVFFRADDFKMAIVVLRKMLFWDSGIALLIPGGMTLIIFLGLCAGIAHFARNTFELSHRWKAVPTFALGLLFLLSLWVIRSGAPSPFLYFQF